MFLLLVDLVLITIKIIGVQLLSDVKLIPYQK